MSSTRHAYVIMDYPLREGWESDSLMRSLAGAGIRQSEMTWLTVLEERPPEGLILKAPKSLIEARTQYLLDFFRDKADCCILALGEFCLDLFADCSGIDKWQCSVLRQPSGRTVIPCYPSARIVKDMSLRMWVDLCCQKLARELHNPKGAPQYDMLLNPSLEETLAYLRGPVLRADRVSVDIETGRGQINTVGFAISEREAIAINVLPDRLGVDSHHELWSAINAILKSDQPKILQNFIYEHAYFSKYGIQLRGPIYDTMIAQKLLWPEFPMGLDTVGRMYTDQPYWKEDGKSWNDIRDWSRHYEYNCKDTMGTYAGFLGQSADLRYRGLTDLHDEYLTRLYPAVAEMCSRGIPVSEERLFALRKSVDAEYAKELQALNKTEGAEKLNPRSPDQVKKFLIARGYQVPKKYDSKTKQWKASTDEKSLKKLRLKAPEDPALTHLLKLSKYGKAQSSYLNFTYDADRRMRYSLNAHGTETGRWSGGTDPWDHGVNPQTVPGGNKGINIKSVFEASAGRVLLECDLKQAESRFVAYDSADLNLIRTLEDPTRDIHWEVACEILRTLGKDVPTKKDKFWRQLGKKSGHGANYNMQWATFVDTCLAELDVVLPKKDAEVILGAYHTLFPGIRKWHWRLREGVCQQRVLRTPLGRERLFYGRMDDSTFREAYAYRPQSTIPDITNHLMLHLMAQREQGALDFVLLLQCHDSLLLELPESAVALVAQECLATERWHPKIELAGGTLVIPTEVKTARNWGLLKDYEPQGGVA